MQLAMTAINEQNRLDGLPDVEMGIGLHTGQVIVGNIGSAERLKYGVVGSHVNLTSRIQSFTVGGQILVSETTRREVGRILKTGKQIEVRAKGFEHPVTLCEVLGIGGSHKLMLYQSSDTLTELTDAILLTCLVLEGGLQSDEASAEQSETTVDRRGRLRRSWRPLRRGREHRCRWKERGSHSLHVDVA